jgi:hypothetical protein
MNKSSFERGAENKNTTAFKISRSPLMSNQSIVLVSGIISVLAYFLFPGEEVIR